MGSSRILDVMRAARATWVLVVLGLAGGILVNEFGGDQFQEVWFAIGNIVIAAGYLTIFITVVPFFKLPVEAKLGAMLFFLVGAATHLELAAHTFADDSSWLTEWHMIVVHTVQPLVLWMFVLGLQTAQIIPRRNNDTRTRSTDVV